MSILVFQFANLGPNLVSKTMQCWRWWGRPGWRWSARTSCWWGTPLPSRGGAAGGWGRCRTRRPARRGGATPGNKDVCESEHWIVRGDIKLATLNLMVVCGQSEACWGDVDESRQGQRPHLGLKGGFDKDKALSVSLPDSTEELQEGKDWWWGSPGASCGWEGRPADWQVGEAIWSKSLFDGKNTC